MDKALEKDVSGFSKIVTWLLVLSPIIRNYGWGRYDFSFIATVVLAVVYLMKYGFRNRMPGMLALYLAYCYVSVIINATSVSSLMELSIPKVFLSYMMFFDVVNMKYLIKVLKTTSIVFVIFFFAQEISYYVTGRRIIGMLTFLPLNIGLSGSDIGNYYSKLVVAERSASFFSEPSHFAQFVLIALCLELFYDKSKKHLLYSSLLLGALVLSQTGAAILGLLVVFVFYLIPYLKRKSFQSKIIAIFFVIVSIAGVVYFTTTSMGQKMMERSEQLSATDHGTAMSGFRRIYRGYFVFAEYSPIEAITGIYNGITIEEKIRQTSVADTFVSENDQYFNMVHNILLRTGILGALMCILIVRVLWKNNSYTGHAILAVFVSLCFIESLFFKELTALYLVLVYKMQLDNIESLCKNQLYYERM